MAATDPQQKGDIPQHQVNREKQEQSETRANWQLYLTTTNTSERGGGR